jgi:hypothetical protein
MQGAQAAADLTPVGSAGSVQVVDVVGWLRNRPELRRTPKGRKRRLATGLPELDRMLDGGLPQAAITELIGPGSSGRTALISSILAAATGRGEVVAWVDPSDALDPLSVEAAGVSLERLLWVRPNGRDALKQSLQAADLILDAGGFAALVLDLAGTRGRAMMNRPAWWVRLTRRLETGRTALITLAAREVTGSSGALRLGCRRRGRRLEVEVQRRRGGAPGGRVMLTLGAPVD